MPAKPDQERKLRAILMLNKVIGEGKSKKQVAKELGVSHDTVERTLAWARQANVFVEYEHRLYDELVPLAHEAIKLALSDGDAQVALKVMESIGLGASRMKQTKAQEDDQEGLYGEIARLRAGSVVNVTPGRLAPVEQTGTTVDAVSDGVEQWGVHGLTTAQETEGEDRQDDVDEDA